MTIVVCIVLFFCSLIFFLAMIFEDVYLSYLFRSCFVVSLITFLFVVILSIFVAFHNGHEMDNVIRNVEKISKQEVVYISDLNEYYEFLKIDKYIDTDKPVKITFVKAIDRVKFSYKFNSDEEPYIARIENVRKVERGK